MCALNFQNVHYLPLPGYLPETFANLTLRHRFILSRFRGVTIDRVWTGYWVYLPLIHPHSELQVFTALSLIYTLQFTVTHTLGFSVFTSRILATDFNTVNISVLLNYTLQISHVKSYLERLTFKSQPNSLQSILNYLRLLPGGSRRKHSFHRYSSTIPRLLLAYLLQQEPVYRVVA
jgi:hypothetical protein